MQIIVESVKPVENSNIVTLSLTKEVPFEKLIAIKDSIANFKGSDPLVIKTVENGKETKILASPNFWINASNDLTQTIEKQFNDCLEISVNSLE